MFLEMICTKNTFQLFWDSFRTRLCGDDNFLWWLTEFVRSRKFAKQSWADNSQLFWERQSFVVQCQPVVFWAVGCATIARKTIETCDLTTNMRCNDNFVHESRRAKHRDCPIDGVFIPLGVILPLPTDKCSLSRLNEGSIDRKLNIEPRN